MNDYAHNDQVSAGETSTILACARACLRLTGDLVEFGCYRGDTSLLLTELIKRNNSAAELWLYDSFEGLPEKTEHDDSVAGAAFQAGALRFSKRDLLAKFKKAGFEPPVVVKGFFEELDSRADLPARIAFAFLDGDLYQSIKTSLELVEQKMVPSGIILVHDYNNPQLPGAGKAVDEWCARTRCEIVVKGSLAIIRWQNNPILE